MYRTLLHLKRRKPIGKRAAGQTRRNRGNIPDEHLAQSPGRFAILELLCVGELERGVAFQDTRRGAVKGSGVAVTDLKVHVGVGADEETLVLESPLETNKHRLPGQLLQERLWVDR